MTRTSASLGTKEMQIRARTKLAFARGAGEKRQQRKRAPWAGAEGGAEGLARTAARPRSGPHLRAHLATREVSTLHSHQGLDDSLHREPAEQSCLARGRGAGRERLQTSVGFSFGSIKNVKLVLIVA